MKKKQKIAVIGPNPIHKVSSKSWPNPIQSMDGSNPCPTLCCCVILQCDAFSVQFQTACTQWLKQRNLCMVENLCIDNIFCKSVQIKRVCHCSVCVFKCPRCHIFCAPVNLVPMLSRTHSVQHCLRRRRVLKCGLLVEPVSQFAWHV